MEDLRSFHIAFGMLKFFLAPVVLQPTWNKLIRVVLSANVGPVTTELVRPVETKLVREYQQTLLGNADGETCLLELLPLPSPSTKDWFYAKHSQLPQLATREAYKKHYMPLRAAHIAQLIA